jgi:hypothetical protein
MKIRHAGQKVTLSCHKQKMGLFIQFASCSLMNSSPFLKISMVASCTQTITMRCLEADHTNPKDRCLLTDPLPIRPTDRGLKAYSDGRCGAISADGKYSPSSLGCTTLEDLWFDTSIMLKTFLACYNSLVRLSSFGIFEMAFRSFCC